MIKKSLIFSMIILFFIGCINTKTRYSYNAKENEDSKKYNKYLRVYGFVENSELRSSLLSEIVVASKQSLWKNKRSGVKILSDKVKVRYKEKDYYFTPKVNEYNSTRIKISTDEVKIVDEFTIYLGKVVVDNKLILDMPPIELQEYLFKERFNGILDVLNQPSRTTIYSGPTKDYKSK